LLIYAITGAKLNNEPSKLFLQVLLAFRPCKMCMEGADVSFFAELRYCAAF
jgi:hypothetical protein